MFERHRLIVSVTLSILILTVVGVTVSSFSPSKKSEYFRELKEIYNTVNNYDSKEINSWESAKNTLVDLNYWYDFIPRYDAISDEDNDVLIMQNKVRELTIRQQLRTLPEIRKYFGEYLSEKLSGLNYKVTILNDERNKIVVFTHDSFTGRSALEKFHNTVANDLRILGFKQIRYKWYELEKSKDEKYIHYNFSDLPDNEPRKFNISVLKN
ncbi:MAG: hypothetical protein HXY48_05820 [Ignavibacteriaceae bacterium]|jgi:hypothetical protein|nr:hypothetical protein [Ignavibacteriaceae bacterium]